MDETEGDGGGGGAGGGGGLAIAALPRPHHIVMIVADSLRWDSVYGGDGPRLPWLQANARVYTGARSAGCWTLPATASMFTGLLPHEHGADTQSRNGLHPELPTLAERMRACGYATHQVTANVATTDIFGLDRGFDEVVRIWKEVPPQHKKLHELMVLVGKPRLRRKVLSTDWVRGKLSEDIEAGKVWLQDTVADVFDRARRILAENDRKNQPTFLFLNLMETHFPYHVSPIFEPLGRGFSAITELIGLYHLVNQTFMARGSQPIAPDTMARIKSRQRVAWERIAGQVDAFVREMYEGQDALVVFGSDHGECFGEMGWAYHFNNVTDGGNRIPLFWLQPGVAPGEVETPVSGRDVFGSLLAAVGEDVPATLVAEPEASECVLESAWYDSQGKTLEKYKYNQLCFVRGRDRYLLREGVWYGAPTSTLAGETDFQPLGSGVDPIEELGDGPAQRARRRRMVADFEAYSERIS